MRTTVSTMGNLVSGNPITKSFCRFIIVLMLLLGLQNGLLFAQYSRQQILEKRKALLSIKNNPRFQSSVKLNNRVLTPHKGQCEFTLDSVHATNNPLSQIIQSLAGPGITISNIQTNLPASSSFYGSFSCGSAAKLGLENGLVLTTGNVDSAKGPNDDPGKTGFNYPPLAGYSLLDGIANGQGFDACWVAFDIVSNTDSIKFDYVFASEEYKEFVNTQYNDVFGFFISGPGITGQQNLAVLPGTTTPVTINSINHLTNSQFYIDNDFLDYVSPGDPPTIDATRFANFEYDGLTKVLTARAKVTPGQTYHLILAIEDVGDEILDSGVFLKGGGITGGACNMTLSATHTDLTCPGANNGSINLTIANGKAPFDIKWSNNATTEDLNNLPAGNYTVTVIDASPCLKTLQVTVGTGTATITPSVIIAPNPGNTICAGTNVTFTAIATNGGTAPVYQWKLNGVNVGTNSNTYQNAALTNGARVTCVITSNAACATPNTATSNEITMNVNAAVTPTVSIAASPGNTICSGTNVTFTATPTNGGTTPSYQWKLNGTNVGTNSATYQNAALANGAKVTCVMTSSLACANPTTATSSELTITVTPAVAPSVSIAANPGSTICSGTNVTFTATPTNGGTTPSYQWKLNGTNVGTNSNTYQNAALTNGAKVTCVMTSSLACANPTTATSNEVIITVTAAVAPTVTIAASPGNTICAGSNVTFTATPTNGGTTPSYQWKLNGTNVGTNSATYQNAALANGAKVSCVITSSLACANPTTATSNEITITVTAAVAPSVSIAASPGNTICSGTNVTFTATPTNGGTTPSYQWKLNGVNVGTNSNTYQNTALTNGAKVTCVMTSSLACANPTTATSNELTITVTPAVAPSVGIAASPGSTICSGTNVIFTATPTNGGTTPSYQWKLNGINVGTNSNTYQNAALTNGAKVTCVMTSSLACANPTTATSNEVTITVTAAVAPTVTIAASPGNTICAGTNVTFTATPTNGGTTPSYQWKLNGTNVGTNSNTYQNAALANGAKVTCVITSSLACANPTTATSNEVAITVTAAVAPSLSIAANPGNTICAGTNVTFTATPTNGGSTPSYQWKLNGVNVGTNSNTYQNTALTNGAKVTCVMTSSLACANPTTATSNEITIAVTAAVAPTVSIAANPGNTICAGTSVTFTATPTNGGTTPSYQWKLNGTNVGTNSNTYQNAALINGAKVTCVMTSSLACANPTTATSNEVTIVVTAAVAPTVTIAASPGNTICAGTNVTFTATPTNGGTTPSYQWKLNGTNVGTNSNTYQNAALANGAKVTCVITSSLACANPTTATSNEVTITVTAAVAPSVSITASTGNTICSGTNVTFTATPTNGGATPGYQWKLNGTNVGTNSNTYQNAALTNGAKVTCVMTSSLACTNPTTATSNEITIAVTAAVAPTVSIAANPGNTICAGTSVTFTATPTNGGTTPSYQWKLNGTNVGTNSNTYQNAALINGAKVTCVMTSSLTCANPTTATSNELAIVVTAPVTPSVSIAANTGNTICAGTNVTFTATPTNGGTTPGYQWKLNGANVGTNSNTYQNAALTNGAKVTCVMTTSLACVNVTTDLSNEIAITVTAAAAPSVSIAAGSGNTICAGTNVIFTATPTNGGTNPNYQWKLNGTNVGTNSNTYQNAALTNGAKVTCVMTSSLACANPTNAASNEVTMTVNASPTLTIAADPGNTFCPGTTVTFTATAANAGTTSSYQWKLNGTNVGGNSNIYQNPELANGNKITCVMSTNATCGGETPVSSNEIAMTRAKLGTCMVFNYLNTRKTSVKTFHLQEGNSGENKVDLKVQIPRASAKTVYLKYRTESGTALPNVDYKPAEGTIQFAPGVNIAFITVTILGDVAKENNEAFYIQFPEAKGTRWRILIMDDDNEQHKVQETVTRTENKRAVSLPEFKASPVIIQSLLRRYEPLLIKGLPNTQNTLYISDLRGVLVAKIEQYSGNWIPGSLTPGLYFYQLYFRNQQGELERKTGKIQITD